MQKFSLSFMSLVMIVGCDSSGTTKKNDAISQAALTVEATALENSLDEILTSVGESTNLSLNLTATDALGAMEALRLSALNAASELRKATQGQSDFGAKLKTQNSCQDVFGMINAGYRDAANFAKRIVNLVKLQGGDKTKIPTWCQADADAASVASYTCDSNGLSMSLKIANAENNQVKVTFNAQTANFAAASQGTSLANIKGSFSMTSEAIINPSAKSIATSRTSSLNLTGDFGALGNTSTEVTGSRVGTLQGGTTPSVKEQGTSLFKTAFSLAGKTFSAEINKDGLLTLNKGADSSISVAWTGNHVGTLQGTEINKKLSVNFNVIPSDTCTISNLVVTGE